MDNPILTPRIDRADLARRISELRSSAAVGGELERQQFGAIEAEFQTLAREVREQLLGTSLAWSGSDRKQAAWLRRVNDDLALAGHALWEAFGRCHGPRDARTRDLMARTLLHMGEVVKWEVAVARDQPHDFAKPHAIMSAAMAAGQHRQPLRLRVDEREVDCDIESLYFRTLLLARFSSGALNSKQIEILDAWMWLWMPALRSVEGCPALGALRADLDSSEGLRVGPRPDPGPALYLPSGPIEEAYRSIIREFHAGRMVPTQGLASGFRLEEHVAVLDLIRTGLRQGASAPVARAPRRGTDYRVELLVGLAEVLARGFCPAPAPAPALTLAARDGQRVDGGRLDRDRDTGADSVYERHRRLVRVANASDTGFGIDGDERDCGEVRAGDIVALRIEAGGPLELCKVVRCVPAPVKGRVWIGARRISARARPIPVAVPEDSVPRAGHDQLLFVPGEDESGRYDACLVPERTFSERKALEAHVGGCIYSFRFNRPRDRGRGWVLAGFEIVAATAQGAA